MYFYADSFDSFIYINTVNKAFWCSILDVRFDDPVEKIVVL